MEEEGKELTLFLTGGSTEAIAGVRRLLFGDFVEVNG